jgi:predicted dehydrogenase
MSAERNDPLRIGYIGTGWTERVQIPAFALGGLRAQAISSRDPENAKRVAGRYSIPSVFSDWRDLVAAADVDVVSIVTPPALHAEMAIAALEAGKHVICEKPTALTVAEAEAMFAAAQAAPTRLAIIDHELRFQPQRFHLRKLVRDGFVGAPLYLELDWRYRHRLDAQRVWSWHSDAAAGGGILGAIGSHLLDLARWILGRIDAITAQLQTAHFTRPTAGGATMQHVTADDSAYLMLRFASGAQGRISATSVFPDDLGMSVTTVGTAGALRVDYRDRLWGLSGDAFPHGEWQEIHPDGPVIAVDQLPNDSPFAAGSYYLARALADAHRQREQLALPEAASFYDGLVVQRALAAAQKSHVERTWVEL